MRKCFSILSTFALSLTLISCSNDDIPGINDGALEDNGCNQLINQECVSLFSKSEYGGQSLAKHGINATDLIVSDAQNYISEKKKFISCTVPIKTQNSIIGQVTIVQFTDDNSFRAIYEMKATDFHSGKQQMYVTTGEGEYIATLEEGDPVLNNNPVWRIIDVAEVSESDVMDKGGRKPGESWWACTARIYHVFKTACNGSNTCELACDLIDAVGDGSCTVSIAIAAAVICR